MCATIKYGKDYLSLHLNKSTEVLEHAEPSVNISPAEFSQKLKKQLPTKADNFKKVGIVVADKTRLSDYPLYLPAIVTCLEEAGTLSENITFYIAYGTHKRQSDEECQNCYGDIYNKYNFIHHDCSTANFTQLGITRFGTPIEIRKDITTCSLLITFGAISHHYFAGYGGGRKLLFPGLSSQGAVFHNHGLFLDKKNKALSEYCQPGILNQNPIAEDLKEIDSTLPKRISIHSILNSEGNVCELHIGTRYNDFLSACSVHDSYYRLNQAKQYKTVIASAGGYPKDINFIQAHKAIHNAAAFVQNGGALIMFLKCIDAIGSNTFMKYFSLGSTSKVFEILSENYEGNGGTALSLMHKTKRIKIYIVTELEENICTRIGLTKINLEKVNQLISDSTTQIAYIENASLLIK